MLTKGQALKILEKTNNHQARVPCHVLFVTANREAWKKKQRLMRKLGAIVPLDRETPEAIALRIQISKIDCGGRPIQHESVVLSGPRGIHSKRAKELKEQSPEAARNPNHWKNRTRNLVFLPSDAIRTMHNSLLLRVNHTKVLY
jgi:hypothetical protein